MRAPDFDVIARDVPRDLFPSGRVRFSLGTTAARDIRRRKEALTILRDRGEWDVIHAVSIGTIPISELERRVRTHGESAIPELRTDVRIRGEGAVPTLREEVEEYLEWYAKRRKVHSMKTARSRLKRICDFIGDVRLTELTSEMADTALDSIGGAPNSRRQLVHAGSGLYTWSIKREAERARVESRVPLWSHNPWRGLDKPSQTRRPVHCTDDQIRDLIASAELYQLAYLRMFVQMGLRQSELTHLRLHVDLDLERWVCRIQSRAPDERCPCGPCQHDGWSPKSSRGTRAVSIPESQVELREAISAYLEMYPAKPGDFVFRNPRTGGPWLQHSIRLDFEALCKRTGIRYGRDKPGGITIHTLRHTAITQLVRAGVRESVIAAIAGDTLEAVMIYVHLDHADLGDGLARGPRYA